MGDDLDMVMRYHEKFLRAGLRLTRQRRLIVETLSKMEGHPTVSDVYECVRRVDSRISLGTLYRTLGLLERYDLIERHDFGLGGREGARFENVGEKRHHDHLIDVETGEVLEFREEGIEALQKEVAERLGYELRGHRLELYAIKKRK